MHSTTKFHGRKKLCHLMSLLRRKKMLRGGGHVLNYSPLRFVIHVLILILVEGNWGKLDMCWQTCTGAASRSERVIIGGMTSHLTNGTRHTKCGTCTVLRTKTSLLGNLIFIANRFTNFRCQNNHIQPEESVEEYQRHVGL